MTLEELAHAKGLRSVGRTAAWLAKQVELSLAEVDLSLSQYRILGLLDEGSAVSSALAERLAVRPPSVTAVIDGLVTRDLVARRHAEDDRRRVSHQLTDLGHRILADADAAVDARLEMLANRLPSARARDRAIEDLALWQKAMTAHREALAAARR
jgi:DNA-binding MarR family transcriptional regulator